MNLPGLLADHGHWVLAVGRLLEGETEPLLGEIKRVEGWLLLCLATTGAAWWWVQRQHRVRALSAGR